MGAWGAGIFSNDIAADIRGDFRDLLAYGRSAQEAIDAIIQEYALKDVCAETSDGWLALARVTWEYGLITDEIRDTALRLISEGTAEELWHEESEKARLRRKQVLQAEAARLQSDPPNKKRPRPEKLYGLNWKPGEVYSFELGPGETRALLVLRVFHYRPSKYAPDDACVNYPDGMVLLDWKGHHDGRLSPNLKEVQIIAMDQTVQTPFRTLHFETILINGNPYDIKRKTGYLYTFIGQVSLELVERMEEHIRKNKNRSMWSINLDAPAEKIQKLLSQPLIKTVSFTI